MANWRNALPDAGNVWWRVGLWCDWLCRAARETAEQRPLLPLAATVVCGCALGSVWLRPRVFGGSFAPQRPLPWLDPLLMCALVLTCAALCFQLRRAAHARQRQYDKRQYDKREYGARDKISTRRGFASGYAMTAALFCFLVGGFALLTARRSVPPHDDVSATVRDVEKESGVPAQGGTAWRWGPQRPLEVSLEGWIADSPRWSEFGAEFPLQCKRIALPRKTGVMTKEATIANDVAASGGARETVSDDSVGDSRVANSSRKLSRIGTEPASLWRESRGRVWARVPLGVPLEVGDRVVLQAQMTDLPRVGNEGERTQTTRFLSQNCWCLARVRKVDGVRIVRRGDAFALARTLARWRQNLLAHYETAFAPFAPHEYSSTETAASNSVAREEQGAPYAHATAQLLTAMVFGEGGLREPLPRWTRERFRAAGLSHLLVASGTQVSFCALLLLGAARGLGLRRVWLLLFVVPPLLLYALLAGGAASIWRATVGGACLAWALLEGRDIDGLSLWSLALCILLLLDPAGASDLGFQLTFAATWGLLALSPVLRRLLHDHFGTEHLDTRQRKGAHGDDTRGEQSRKGDDATLITGRNFWLDLAALSLGAQLATAPLLLHHFGRLSVAGLGANFIGVPLAGVLVATGLAGLVWLPANALSYALVRFLDAATTWAAQAPGAQTSRPPLLLGWTLGCYALLACALLRQAAQQHALTPQALSSQTKNDGARRDQNEGISGMSTHVARWREAALRELTARRARNRGWRPQSVVVLIMVLAACGVAWRVAARRSALLRVTILDVGQGESILIESPNGRAVLIDGGTREDEKRGEVGNAIIVPYLQARGIRHLNAIVLTHADSDHCNALPAVVREVPVDLALDGAQSRDELGATSQSATSQSATSQSATSPGAASGALSEYEELRAAWRERGVAVRAARVGQRLQLGDGVVLKVLAPLAPVLEGDNNNCAVLRLEYGEVSFLLTGDIEREAEERLARRGIDLKCTVLKVAHHGSKTSTSPEFLRAADPQIAVVSCGRYNSFGHPAPQTLRALSNRGVPLFRTDVQGAIEITSDGQKCWVQTFR